MKGVETNTDTQNSFTQIQLKVDRSDELCIFFKTLKMLIHWKGPQAAPSDVLWILRSNTSPLCSPNGALHGKTEEQNFSMWPSLCKSPTCSPGRNYYLNHDREKPRRWEEVGIAEGGKCPGRRRACEEAGKVSALLVTVLEDRVTSWFQEIELRHKCFLGGRRDGWVASSLSQLTGQVYKRCNWCLHDSHPVSSQHTSSCEFILQIRKIHLKSNPYLRLSFTVLKSHHNLRGLSSMDLQYKLEFSHATCRTVVPLMIW